MSIAIISARFPRKGPAPARSQWDNCSPGADPDAAINDRAYKITSVARAADGWCQQPGSLSRPAPSRRNSLGFDRVDPPGPCGCCAQEVPALRFRLKPQV